MAEMILKAEHLSKSFPERDGRKDAVKDVSFALYQGECLGIVGESGSGKSTIAKMLTRLTDTTQGSIKIEGKDITHVREKELRELYRNIQMVFQMPAESFDPRHTLGEGIGESLKNIGMKKKEIAEKTVYLLKKCGLSEEYAGRYPHQVSGGQCQRAAIARALAADPKILICDEATSALDVTVQKQILELLTELKKEGMSMIMICHDLALVQKMCDRVLVLYQGKIVESGTTEEVIKRPKEEYTKKLIESAG